MASFALQQRPEAALFNQVAHLDEAMPSPADLGPVPDGAAGGAADLGYAQHWADGPDRSLERELDFTAAKQDLAKLFQIVDPDAVGPRLGNQVTEEEYEDICHRFSAIRMGDSSLRFSKDDADDKDYKNFNDGAMDDIAALLQTSTGRDLIRTFDGGHEPLVLDSMIAKPNEILDGVASDRFLFEKLGDAYYDQRGAERPPDGHGDPRTLLSSYLAERRAIDRPPQND